MQCKHGRIHPLGTDHKIDPLIYHPMSVNSVREVLKKSSKNYMKTLKSKS